MSYSINLDRLIQKYNNLKEKIEKGRTQIFHDALRNAVLRRVRKGPLKSLPTCYDPVCWTTDSSSNTFCTRHNPCRLYCSGERGTGGRREQTRHRGHVRLWGGRAIHVRMPTSQHMPAGLDRFCGGVTFVDYIF